MNHHTQALGWTLVHFCWQAGAIALVYWLADAMLSKARSQTRYLVALGTMLLMLAAAAVTFTYEETRSESRLPQIPIWSQEPAAADSSEVSAAPQSVSPLVMLNVNGATHEPVRWIPTSLLPWLDVAWLAGVALFSARTIGGWRLITRLQKQALREVPEALEARLAVLCRRMGITRHVRLFASERIRGPVMMGVMRAMILLPVSSLSGLSMEQLDLVLAHELAHIRRADYFWNLLQTMIETLFFFHPAVWWLGRKVRQQRELCCDDIVVSLCADPVMYATALLRLEEHRRSELDLGLAMALDGHRPHSGLRSRILRLLGDAGAENEQREFAPLPLAAVSALLLLLLLPAPQLFAGLWPKAATPPTAALKPSVLPTLAPTAPATTAVIPPKDVVPAPRTTTANRTSDEGSSYSDRDVTIGGGTSVSDNVSMSVGVSESVGVGSSSSSDGQSSKSSNASSTGPKTDYITAMRAAGYDVDIDKYIAMKVQSITPEYAREMAQAGFGKPSADELIGLKVQGVTPEYINQLKSAGFAPESFSDVISDRIFNVTPEFVAGMKAAGFDAIPPKKLIELRVHNVSPEFAKTVRQQYPNATLNELVQLRIFNIDDAFLASAKAHGFANLSIQKLVQLRISGILDDESVKP